MDHELTTTYEAVENEMDVMNELSECLIREDYLKASLEGPHWALGLDGKVI
jgi:hypothetical protein